MGAGALRLVAAAAMLGVAGAWLLGVWLHVRLGRRARTAGARRIIRFVIAAPASVISNRFVQELSNDPRFAASITGRLESVLTAVITPIRGSMRAAPPAARVGCRLDDLGAECRLRVRVDFTPLLERSRGISQRWVFLVWPIWAFFAVTGALLQAAIADAPSPWQALWLFAGALPIAGEIAIVGRCNRMCRRLGDAVIGTADDLRSSLLV